MLLFGCIIERFGYKLLLLIIKASNPYVAEFKLLGEHILKISQFLNIAISEKDGYSFRLQVFQGFP